MSATLKITKAPGSMKSVTRPKSPRSSQLRAEPPNARPRGNAVGLEARRNTKEEWRHVRTRLAPGMPDVPLQVDYVFASEPLVRAPLTCDVLDESEWVAFSDHAPILATFEARG
jgi:endonuclease/exonuclease/phosphatase family metal-dependent hydrolase